MLLAVSKLLRICCCCCCCCFCAGEEQGVAASEVSSAALAAPLLLRRMLGEALLALVGLLRMDGAVRLAPAGAATVLLLVLLTEV
jgi:hypothetical protein